MPLINVYTSAELPSDDESQTLLRNLSKTLARLLGKPESYVMTCLVPRTRMTFAGSFDPACLVEIKSIGGITRESAVRLSEAVCKEMCKIFGVPTNRSYVVLDDVPAHMWGFDGTTFG
jgi:phenylpyruvate tautomerase PptA (4-oxalocrotonate tautomerase family)